MQTNERKGSLTDAFRSFGAEPSEELWSAISEQMDKPNKRRLAVIWWLSGLAGMFALILMLTLHYSREEKRFAAHKPAPISVPKTEEKAGNSAQKGDSTIRLEISPAIPTSVASPVADEYKCVHPVPVSVASSETDPEPDREKEMPTNSIDFVNEANKSSIAMIDRLPALNVQQTIEADINRPDRVRHKPFMDRNPKQRWPVPQATKWKAGIQFGYSNSLGEYSYINNYLPLPSGYDPLANDAPQNYRCLSATIARRVKRWWFESGIQLGRFKAMRVLDTTQPYLPDFQIVVARTLTIGIPLAARYDLYYQPWTHSQLYARIGTVQNFPVYRSDTYFSVQNSSVSSFREARAYFNYYGSVCATLGIEQHIWKGLSVDVRPEFTFYYRPPTNSVQNPKVKVFSWYGWNFAFNWTF